jgi:hypothetical protein|tara:strand:+ start:953 stop:1087 length:135 start_codon:yes stop_codon:yes gene_type:complete
MDYFVLGLIAVTFMVAYFVGHRAGHEQGFKDAIMFVIEEGNFEE